MRFCIYTRGRSGSTAITEELNNHPQLTCYGEVFRPDPIKWVTRAYEKYGKDYPKLTNSPDRVLPYKFFVDGKPEDPITRHGFASYLAFLESEAETPGVGWKFISNVPGDDYFGHCAANDVRVIYLRRRNMLRQAVSALIANETGVYNSKNYEPQQGRKFEIEPRKVNSRIRMAQSNYQSDDEAMQAVGLRSIVVYYEDWVDDRAGFFASLGEFLDVEHALPDPSTYAVTTPEPLEELLSNYEAVSEGVRKAGFGQFLNEAN